MNGASDLPLSENGSCRSDHASSRSASPDETPTRSRLPSDAGKCHLCSKTGPKSRLKMKNGVRICATCFSKKPACKLGLFNPVTSSLSEYDFPGGDTSSEAREQQQQQQQAAQQEPPAAVDTEDTRKKARLTRKATVAHVSREQHDCLANRLFLRQTPTSEAPSEAPVPVVTPAVGDLFIPASGRDPKKWKVGSSYRSWSPLAH